MPVEGRMTAPGPARLYLLAAPALLLGALAGHLEFAYPPIDIDGIKGVIADGHGSMQGYFGSSPAELINNGRTVLLTTDCDVRVAAMTNQFAYHFPEVHFVYDSPVHYGGGDHGYDVEPCRSAEEHLGGPGLIEPSVVELGVLPGATDPATGSVYHWPDDLIIESGDSIRWHNRDAHPHTVTSGGPEGGPDGRFDSGPIPPGGSWEHTFGERGTYPYYCSIHPWARGEVVVWW
ncbi:MAG: hypothetical protein MPI91_08320 [Nitrosopumilus sp.]|nr:hypothetical protein [Nitrosopumilus sp.]